MNTGGDNYGFRYANLLQSRFPRSWLHVFLSPLLGVPLGESYGQGFVPPLNIHCG